MELKHYFDGTETLFRFFIRIYKTNMLLFIIDNLFMRENPQKMFWS